MSQNKQVYVVRRPIGAQGSSRILSPDRSPPAFVANSQPYVVQTRQRSRTPSPIRTYYPQPTPRPEQYAGKPVVLVHPNNQSAVVVENSRGRGDTWRSPAQYSNTHRSYNDINYKSTDNLVGSSRVQRFLDYLSRHMSLIIIVALIILGIAIADIVICSTFLGINSSLNTSLKIAGIIIGIILALIIIVFLCFLLCGLGKREGFFSYFDRRPRVGGQAYALMPPPNSEQYGQTVRNGYSPGARTSNVVYASQPAIYKPSAVTSSYESKPNGNNIVVQMPENYTNGRQMTPKTRERSLNKVMKNINHVVEDAKKRNNGEVPSTVVVKVDP